MHAMPSYEHWVASLWMQKQTKNTSPSKKLNVKRQQNVIISVPTRIMFLITPLLSAWHCGPNIGFGSGGGNNNSNVLFAILGSTSTVIHSVKQRLLRNRRGSALRPLATSCAKDYKAHSLLQTSFAESPNSVEFE